MADIPGLIKGAHSGKGLGVQFLRHVERTKVLLFLIEATSSNPKEDYTVLLNELKLFNRALPRKPKIIALTKADLLNEQERRAIKKIKFGVVPTLLISSVANFGIDKLILAMWKAIDGKKRQSVQD